MVDLEMSIVQKLHTGDKVEKKPVSFMTSKKLLYWHSWAGVVAGIGLLLLSVTGSVLCFKEELLSWVHPELYGTGIALGQSLSHLYKGLEEGFPEWYTVRLYLPQHAGETYQAFLQHRLNADNHITVYYTNTGWSILKNSWLYYAEELHYYLLLPRYSGLVLNFVLSISLLILTITGFVIYKKPIVKVITFKSGLKFNNAKGWHTSIGMVVLLFITVMSVTSTIITFSGVIGGPRSSKFFQTVHPEGFNPDKLALAAEKHKSIPEASLKSVSFLNGKTMFHYEVVGLATVDEFCRIFLNPVTGEKISIAGRTDNKLLRALNSCVPFHFGNFGGVLLKAAYCVGAVLLSLLTITGGLIYFKRDKRKTPKTQKALFTKGLAKEVRVSAFRYGFMILAVFAVLGLIYGVFIGDPVKGSVYLLTLLLFPAVLNALLLALFWPFYFLIVKVKKGYVNALFAEYSSYSLWFFIIGVCWYGMVYFI